MDATPRPAGDASRHLNRADIEAALANWQPARDRAAVELIVVRGPEGVRHTPERARLTRAGGLPGDAWARKQPLDPASQISLMNAAVARAIANGQALSLFGDNLLADLDLSLDNLPVGARLRIGATVLEVTAKPHHGCAKFRQRFGLEALRYTAEPALQSARPRGLYLQVIEDGEVGVGDAIEVIRR